MTIERCHGSRGYSTFSRSTGGLPGNDLLQRSESPRAVALLPRPASAAPRQQLQAGSSQPDEPSDAAARQQA